MTAQIKTLKKEEIQNFRVLQKCGKKKGISASESKRNILRGVNGKCLLLW